MSGITLTEVADATIPTPAAGKETVYLSAEEGGPAHKDSTGTVTSLTGATGATGAAGPAGTPAFPIEVIAHGGIGVAETFDFGSGPVVPSTSGPVHTGTMDDDCTITLDTDITTEQSVLEIWLVGDGTPRSLTWDPDITWQGGSAPTLDYTLGAINRLIFESLDGTAWLGLLTGPGPTGPTGPAALALAGDSGTATSIDDITFVGATVTDDTGGAATVTITGAADIVDIPTAEMDDTLVLAPDGAGGVEFRAETGGGGYAEGTSFPVSPTTGDKFYRTDRDILYVYDGTRWLSVQLYRDTFAHGVATMPLSATLDPIGYLPTWATEYDLWLVALYSMTYVSTTNDGTKYWTHELYKEPLAGGAGTSVVSFNTSAHTASRSTPTRTAIGALLANGTFGDLAMRATKTSTPGNCYYAHAIAYRLVG